MTIWQRLNNLWKLSAFEIAISDSGRYLIEKTPTVGITTLDGIRPPKRILAQIVIPDDELKDFPKES